MDLVYTNPWHPLAKKHLTTASAYSPATSGMPTHVGIMHGRNVWLHRESNGWL